MATTVVDSSVSDHLDHLHSESIPSIELNFFSQAELFSLSLCSASSSLHQHQNDPDVSTLKIDRSVFNESAGSRKQTFSRIRLAPRSSSQFPPSSSIYTSIHHQTAEQTLDDDSPQIIAHLKSLFGGNSLEVSNIEVNLVSVPVQYNGFIENAAVGGSDCNGGAEIKQMAVEDSNAKKRKRGGPRKEESNSIIRLEEFVNLEDPYVRELNRRTLDMQTREQLLEFLQGLDGEWLSNRKKRKIVGASALGDFLPTGWKLMLCLMRRAGYFWIDCRRYISPNGQQFMSCKEASSYLNSPLVLQDASKLGFGHVDDIQMTEKKSYANAADLNLVVGKNDGALVSGPGLSLSESVQLEKKSVEVGIRGQDGTVRNYKCHKCTMVFYEPDDLLQHLLSSHPRVPKRVGQETSNEEVIFINGRYECQFCDKSYDERHRYNGHLGNHIKDYFKRIQASGEATKIQRSTVPSLVAAHPSAMSIHESTGIDIGSVATNSNFQSNDEHYDVLDSQIKENAADESNCHKQDSICCMIDDKPRDSNDNVAVETEQMSAPDNIVNQHVNLNKGHPQKIGSDCRLVVATKTDDGETIKDNRLLSDAINNTEIHDKDFFGEDKGRTVSGNNCSSQEDVAANGIEQIDLEGCLLIPFCNDQKYASVNDVHGLSASTTVDMTYGRVSLLGPSSPLNEKVIISNDKVTQVSTTAMKEPRYNDIGSSNNNVLPVGSGSNNVTVEDFATGSELENSSRCCLVIPTWNDQTFYAENKMKGTYRCTITKDGQEMKSEGEQLTLFASEQCLGSEDTINEASNDARDVTDHDDILYVQDSMQKKGVGLAASHVTAVELESSSGNSLHVPSCNGLAISLQENEVLNGAPENLGNRNSDSDLHKPSDNDQVLKYENNVKMVSSFGGNQLKGDTHITLDGTHMEWDAGASKSTILERYSNDCSLVYSGSQWNATKVNITGQYCSPPDEQKQVSAKCSLNLSNSVEDWITGNNSNKVFTGQAKEKLKVVKPRKNDGATGFSSNIQATESVMSDFMWKHDEESYLQRSYADASGVPNSSSCFTTYGLLSDKGGDELFGEKFSGISGFEVLRSGNMENMEYNFMSNHPEESKVFPVDTEIVQRLGSPDWLEKEALPLLPNTASRRHFPASCVWCKNEFHVEDSESETQIGSLNFTCATCKAKFSSDFS